MSDYVMEKYRAFIKKNGYIPKMLEPYNCAEVTDVAPTITTASNTSFGKCGTVLILVEEKKKEDKE